MVWLNALPPGWQRQCLQINIHQRKRTTIQDLIDLPHIAYILINCLHLRPGNAIVPSSQLDITKVRRTCKEVKEKLTNNDLWYKDIQQHSGCLCGRCEGTLRGGVRSPAEERLAMLEEDRRGWDWRYRERELEELGREREMLHGQLDREPWLLDADAREDFHYQRLAADETGARSSGGSCNCRGYSGAPGPPKARKHTYLLGPWEHP